MNTVTITQRGALATIQDLGRYGHAAEGIAPSGALDAPALRLANRLLGNPDGAPAVEVLLGGLHFTANEGVWFAVTGADVSVLLDGIHVPARTAVYAHKGAEVQLALVAAGARVYLAFRGGIDTPLVAGSAATDTMAGLGPAPLVDGDVLQLGAEPAGDVPMVDVVPWSVQQTVSEVRVHKGPRFDWFATEAWSELLAADWTVSTDANRIGVRLDGPSLERDHIGELPSEGMVPGSIQLPPSGRPTVLLADGPVTGGYPVIGVVDTRDLHIFAQVKPGDHVRFVQVGNA